LRTQALNAEGLGWLAHQRKESHLPHASIVAETVLLHEARSLRPLRERDVTLEHFVRNYLQEFMQDSVLFMRTQLLNDWKLRQLVAIELPFVTAKTRIGL